MHMPASDTYSTIRNAPATLTKRIMSLLTCGRYPNRSVAVCTQSCADASAAAAAAPALAGTRRGAVARPSPVRGALLCNGHGRRRQPRATRIVHARRPGQVGMWVRRQARLRAAACADRQRARHRHAHLPLKLGDSAQVCMHVSIHAVSGCHGRAWVRHLAVFASVLCAGAKALF